MLIREIVFKGVREKKKLKKNQIFLSLLKNLNKLSRNKNQDQKNNIMLKLTNKTKRNSKEGCFLYFNCQPSTSHGSAEVSRVKRLKIAKMML